MRGEWQDNSWFLIGMLFLFLLAGCSSNRWSPTDPRTAVPDTSNIQIDTHVELPIGITVTAAALPVLFPEE
jgi:hypothetical protein